MEEDEKKSYWKVGGGKRQQLRTDSALLADREDFKFFFSFKWVGSDQSKRMICRPVCTVHFILVRVTSRTMKNILAL